jgi:hypothetical protein
MHLPLLALAAVDGAFPLKHPCASACLNVTISITCTDRTPSAANNAKIVKVLCVWEFIFNFYQSLGKI